MVEERQAAFVQGSSSRPHMINQHTYRGPVSNIGQALNSNSGVNYGVINQAVYYGSTAGLPLCLTPIPDASHTRNRRISPPNSNCLPGTRQRALERIGSWVMDETFADPPEDPGDVMELAEVPYDESGEVLDETGAVPDEPGRALAESGEFLDDSGSREFLDSSSRASEDPSHHRSETPEWPALFPVEPDFPPAPIPRCTRIVWLCGPVGCGKSAISQAVADDFDRRGLLLGSFFFFRGSGDRSRIARLVVTLAHQMMALLPATRQSVEAALRAPGLEAMSSGSQLERLIFEPLQRHIHDLKSTTEPLPLNDPPAPVSPITADAKPDPPSRKRQIWWKRFLRKVFRRHTRPNSIVTSSTLPTLVTTSPPPPPSTSVSFLVLLDGVDECEDREEVSVLLDDILRLFEEFPNLPLRFLIASRIEEHIRSRIQRPEVHIENLRDDSSRGDIMTVVRHTFEKAAEQSLVIQSYGKTWPHKYDVVQLVQHADGSFVFITTLLNYILGSGAELGDGLTPMDRFDLALNMNSGLDGLYHQILRRARHFTHFSQVVLTIALLRSPLSISDLAEVLHIPAFEVVNTLVPLQSIIHVPGDDTMEVTIFHTSLREFILDNGRSGAIFSEVERNEVGTQIAYECLTILLAPDIERLTPFGTLGHYALENYMSHWEALQDPIEPHLDFLFNLSEPYVAKVPLRIALTACFNSLLFKPQGLLHPSRRTNFPVLGANTEPTCETEIICRILWHSACMGTGNSLRTSGIITQMYGIRHTPIQPDPSLHRCLAIHLMLSLLPHKYPNFPAQIDQNYALEGWAQHLALGIAPDNGLDDKALRHFLEDPHPFSKSKHRSHYHLYLHSAQVQNLISGVQDAATRVITKFPDLPTSTPWKWKPGIDGCWNPWMELECEGFSVVTMLKIFSALLDLPAPWGLESEPKAGSGTKESGRRTCFLNLSGHGSAWFNMGSPHFSFISYASNAWIDASDDSDNMQTKASTPSSSSSVQIPPLPDT